jgi:hypothetical protein
VLTGHSRTSSCQQVQASLLLCLDVYTPVVVSSGKRLGCVSNILQAIVLAALLACVSLKKNGTC